MTNANLMSLAESGQLDLARGLADDRRPAAYCIAASLDRLFERVDVPVEMYHLNDELFGLAEAGDESAVSAYYKKLADTVFKGAPNGEGVEYYFNNEQEFATDLIELRQRHALVLIDTMDGSHVNGLQAVGNDDWRIVGLEDVICIYSHIYGLDVQGLYTDETPLSLEKVWDYMIENNPAGRTQTAVVFPAESSIPY